MSLGGQSSQEPPCHVLINGCHVREVETFKYLGSLCSNNLSMRAEISHRISCAAHAFHRLQKLHIWKDAFVKKGLKSILYNVIVQSTLLYGCEVWTVIEADLHSLKVFQMRCLRTICGVSLRDRVHNDTIFDKCATKHIADMIKYGRLKWLGHVYRLSNECLPKILLFGSLDGPGLQGRPIKSWK
jgi:hypothetical protein